MKLFSLLTVGVLSQYDQGYTGDGETYPADDTSGGSCGPDASYGGAYWPSTSATHPCGVQFWAEGVKANSKCQLQLLGGASYFLTLGGVFVTSPASTYADQTFYFHTYDNWAGQYGASVTNFWQNSAFPDNSTCFDADAICITCTENPDVDYDGQPDPVEGVYLGNFMHDFRHNSPSSSNVPIANSNGHVAGTVYEVTMMDQYGNAVPITDIASHYGHAITSDYTAEGVYYADDGKFALHVGCEDFLGQFLYFSFSHQSEMEANGWYSYVTESSESTADCPVKEVYDNSYATGGDNYDNSNNNYAAAGDSTAYAGATDPYAATGDSGAYAAPAETYVDPYAAAADSGAYVAPDTYEAPVKQAKQPNKNKPNKNKPNKNKQRSEDLGGPLDGEDYYSYDQYNDTANYDTYNYNYRK